MIQCKGINKDRLSQGWRANRKGVQSADGSNRSESCCGLFVGWLVFFVSFYFCFIRDRVSL